MIKVLLVANTDWYLYNFRLSLAKFLCRQGVEVVMVSPRGRFVDAIRSASFKWVEWRMERQSTALISELLSIYQLLQIYRTQQPTLVHHFTIKPVLYGSLAARLARVPAIINSITGLGYLFLNRSPSTSLLREIVLLVYRFLLQGHSIATIFENESNREYFIQHGLVHQEHSVVIEGVGVDPDHFIPALEPPTDSIVVLFPARLLWEKGVSTVVEAARLLRQRYPVRVVLAGEPDPGNPGSVPEAQIRDWVTEGIVEWWGWQFDMRAVYHQSHIVVLPSLGEGLPTALIEAAACGRPIVTTDVPGCREVVKHGENGLIVPPNDPQALSEAIEMLINHPELRLQMGKAGRERVLEKFTDAQVNRQTWNVYAAVLHIASAG